MAALGVLGGVVVGRQVIFILSQPVTLPAMAKEHGAVSPPSDTRSKG